MAKYGTPPHFSPKIQMTQNGLKWILNTTSKSMEFCRSDAVVMSLVNNNPNLHHLDLDITTKKLVVDFSSRIFKSLELIADKCPQLTHIGIGHRFLINIGKTKETKAKPSQCEDNQ